MPQPSPRLRAVPRGEIRRPALLTVLLTLPLAAPGAAHPPETPLRAPTLPPSPPSLAGAALKNYGRLPLRFEANRGQAAAPVKFLTRGGGYTLSLSPAEATFTFGRAPDSPKTGAPLVLRLRLAGANLLAPTVPEGAMEGRVNYLIGNDPRKWRTDIPTCRRVRFRSVYPGIDLVYYGSRPHLEHDFVVAPGADPRRIRMTFDGAAVRSAPNGDLALVTRSGKLVLKKPVAYQKYGRSTRLVPARYDLKGRRGVGFRLGAYDRTRPLVIDPVIVYASYFGGARNERAFGIAADAKGNAYIVGETGSSDLPIRGAFQPVVGGAQNAPTYPDAFVAKLNPAGNDVVYCTYIGGSVNEQAYDVAVDATGSVTVAGWTSSDDFPVKNTLMPRAPASSGFVTRLTPAGDALVYSTFLGGADGINEIYSLAVDAGGSAYVTGRTNATNFPTTANALQKTVPSFVDGFFARINAAGTALTYSTYLPPGTKGQAVVADDNGNAYVSGRGHPENLPTTPDAFMPDDAFPVETTNVLLRFNTEAAAGPVSLIYASYLPSDQVSAMAVGPGGKLYLTGGTASQKYPVTPNAYQGTLKAGFDSFLMVLDPSKSGAAQLVYSTFLGGSGNENILSPGGGNTDPRAYAGVVVDPQGNATVCGVTQSNDFPTKNPIQPSRGDTQSFREGFIAKFNPAAATGPDSLVYSTYYGGSRDDYVMDLSQDPSGNLYFAGWTSSANLPTFNTYQDSLVGGPKAFVGKLTDSTAPQVYTASPARGGNVETVTLSLYGSALPDTAAVTLHGEGLPDIPGGSVRVENGRVITATFRLAGATPGLRDLVVTLPDLPAIVLPNSFTVEEGGDPRVHVDVLGRDVILINRSQPYTIEFSNRGNIDAVGTPIIRLPKTAVWSIDLPAPPVRNGQPVSWNEYLQPTLEGDTMDLALPPTVIPPDRPLTVRIRVKIPETLPGVTIEGEWAEP